MPSFSHCFRWLLLLSVFLAAEEAVQPKKEYYTKKAPKGAVSIDGEINEDIWNSVPWAGGDFIVRSPNEGEAPVANTRFKVLYDESYIYFAIRAYDAEPDKIVRRVARRDRFEGDWVEVNIDSYFDKRTAFSFTITAAGVKGDEFISNDGDNWDASWDPIWYVDTHLDDQGWTAEMKIPFSQIRFNSSDDQIWGLQVNRLNYRNNERSHWIFVPQSSKGWVHEFGELRGISGIEPSRRVEVLPYVVAKNERFPTEAGNPFSDGSDFGGNLGIDAKIGLTSDITMDLTLNPDFGQVEADPSEVNLTAFETFFEEKRPFFIEGRNILDYAVTEAAWGGNYSSDNLFYSRRIGRRPQRFPDVPDGGFVDQPRNSSILGAAKITGKTASGWSLGIMESITAQEKAVIEGDGQRFKEVVEPATNYLLGRLQKDFNGGQRTLGMIATATNRSKESLLADRLHNAAYTGGVDFLQNMNDRVYYLSGNLIGSYVEGDARAIANTQMSSTHYFQRPDADHLDYDSTRTSLSGHGGTLKFGKRGDFKYQGGVTWRSPGLELNDMGFLRRADEVNQWAWMNIRKPNWGGMDSFNWNWNTQS
nr:DUF5916 domain-containing protein [Calditrichia bacterium]